MREIRRLRLEQECGLDIGYRCMKCRDCVTCKNSEKVEAISLREEAEMEVRDGAGLSTVIQGCGLG